MKMFKNLLFAILGVLFLLPISVSANSATSVTLETYHFTNGDYLETILIQDALPRAATSTRSGQKTTYYKSASGTDFMVRNCKGKLFLCLWKIQHLHLCYWKFCFQFCCLESF